MTLFRYSYVIKALIIVVIPIIGSCNKDFLETPPSTSIVRNEYVSDLKTTQNYLNGIFADFSGSFYSATNIIYADVVADNIKPIPGRTMLISQYNWSQITDNGNSESNNMNKLWSDAYRIARNASFVLENIGRFKDEDPATANIIAGNALVLRALVHFQLVNVFAQPYKFTTNASHPGVPYITSSDWKQPVTRQSVDEVYTKMIEDLQTAIPLLPQGKQAPNQLLITCNAAKAILARVYLFKSDFSNANRFAVEVSKAVPIMTGADYPTKLFTPQETESLFQLPPEQVNFYAIFPSYFFRGDIQFAATNDIVNLLSERPGDVRKSWITLVGNDWNITKFPEGVTSAPIPALDYYVTIIRSSEMYLTAAESFARLGVEDSARFYLDAIRQRADPSAPISNITGALLLDSIYKERRKELCFENLRMFDLLRIGKGIDRSDAPPSIQHLPYPSDKSISPIPLLEVQASGLKQNASY